MPKTEHPNTRPSQQQNIPTTEHANNRTSQQQSIPTTEHPNNRTSQHQNIPTTEKNVCTLLNKFLLSLRQSFDSGNVSCRQK
jgi:hypothetical protein